jgi:hypothetical protein
MAAKLEATTILETSRASKGGRKKRLYMPIIIDEKSVNSVKRSADVPLDPKPGTKKIRELSPKLEFLSSTPTVSSVASRRARTTRN